jgi:hypothetical protein
VSCLIGVLGREPNEPEVIAMMHRERGLVSLIAWYSLMTGIVICYAAIVVGIIGVVSAWATSMIIFSGAMAGCVAALIYLISAMHDIRQVWRAH